ncbi:Pseudopaline exporter CntI [Cupriavidus numazuensis]|uniref:Pseudopaline exporter CntI n=2 Tax=Cupriavidus numazuensis TaxID=221992 RepID=A0ABN7Q7G7_9BURK|nr:Pseudopaline exporter CntI [Cupriavidus numazuensis]
MLSFVANDAIVKHLSQQIPTIQVIFVRGFIASTLLFFIVHATKLGSRLGDLRNGRVGLRSAFDGLATIAYLSALAWLPIGNATAINMAAPMLLVFLVVLLTKQSVDARKWMAIGAGFLGVILIVQPRLDGMNRYALLCLLGTFLHACRDFVTRGIDPAISSVIVTLSTSLFVTVLAGLCLSPYPWTPITWQEGGLLCAAGGFLCVGYLLVTISMRAGDVTVVAPFRYTGLIFAIALGWLVWDETPNAAAWTGIAVLFGAGAYVLRRERQRSHSQLDAQPD